jgi:hypothetical protein
MNDDTLEFLEQTTWLMNPSPDRRKCGRKAMQCFPVGTRWIRDGDKVLAGDGSSFHGGDAEAILKACTRVEPGFGRRSQFAYDGMMEEGELQQIVGRLLDQGKITLADIEACIKGDYDQAEEQRFLYRHWIRLDPPNEELAKTLAEEKRVDAIKKEYDKRSGAETNEQDAD